MSHALQGRFSEIIIALLTAADVPRARAALDDLIAGAYALALIVIARALVSLSR